MLYFDAPDELGIFRRITVFSCADQCEMLRSLAMFVLALNKGKSLVSPVDLGRLSYFTRMHGVEVTEIHQFLALLDPVFIANGRWKVVYKKSDGFAEVSIEYF